MYTHHPVEKHACYFTVVIIVGLSTFSLENSQP